MFNWFKKNTDNSRHQSINGNFNNSVANTGDNAVINNQNTSVHVKGNVTNIYNFLSEKSLIGIVSIVGIATCLIIKELKPLIVIPILLLLSYFIYDMVFRKPDIKASEIVDKLLVQHQLDKHAKDKQIKSLISAVTTIMKGKEIIATKSERKDALAALERGNTTLAKKLLNRAAKQIESKVKKDAEIFRDLSAFAFVDNNKQEELVAIYRAEQLAPKSRLLLSKREIIAADIELQKLKNTSSNSEEIAIAYNSLGVVYKTLDNFNKAIQYQEEALEITKSEINRANIYANLGRVYQKKEDFNKSIECYQKSLKIAEEAGYKESMAINYYSLGNIYKQTDKSQAVKYYQMSIDLYHYLGSPNEKVVQGWLDNLK